MGLDELKRIAAAATPGPWGIRPRDVRYYPNNANEPVIRRELIDEDRENGWTHLGADVEGPLEPGRATFVTWDAHFIATFNPELVSKLLSVLEISQDILVTDLTGYQEDRLIKAVQAIVGNTANSEGRA